ncbi:MAG: helix-turn-helix domain-containing protein [Chloroflexota bacterium]|nr:helix-turn-helix domain-containing protein [Chloroflexota bacterium]
METVRETFGELLGRYRRERGLTLEELADRAGLSVRGLNYLEHGRTRSPRKDTVELLAEALGLSGREYAAFKLAARRLPPSAPSGATPSTAPTDFPLPLTDLVGRKQEIGEVRRLLTTTRLLTLTGLGGIGKTRLAMEVARSLIVEYPDGVRLVELAPLPDPALVPGAVAAALGVREQPERSLTDTLASYLCDKRLLLVLDNCEHLLEGCTQLIGTLLRSCSELRVLATSREALHVAGELRWPVPPLSVPDAASVDVTHLFDSDSARLFVERARLVRPDYVPLERDARAIGEICRTLEGIPLAIELAAARVRVLSPKQIAERLEDSLRLLAEGELLVEPRHRAMRVTLDWSWALLGEGERVLLRRLSVFGGGWELSAAEEVGAGGELAPVDVLDVLTHLVDRSLVGVESGTGAAYRYRMLEPVRQYALQRLEESGEAQEVRRRHAEHFLVLAESAEPELRTARQLEWLERLREEQDNLRVALRWSLGEDRGVALRMAGALWRYWFLRGQFGEGERWLSEALSVRGVAPETVEATALLGWAHIAEYTANRALVSQLAEESLELCCRAGDQRGVAAALSVPQEAGHDLPTRLQQLERSVQTARQVGDPWLLARALNVFGDNLLDGNEAGRAIELLEESLVLARPTGDRWLTGSVLFILGKVLSTTPDKSRARRLLEESLSLHEELGDKLGMAYALWTMGVLAFHQGEYAEARRLNEQRLALVEDLDDRRGIANCLWWLSLVACEEGDPVRAGSLAEQSLATADERAETWLSAGAAEVCAWVALQRGDYTQAADTYRKALERFLHSVPGSSAGLRYGVVLCLLGLAAVAQAQRAARRAARLLGTIEVIDDGPYYPSRRSLHEACLARVRATLGDEAFEAAMAEGRSMSLEQAVGCALHDGDAHASATPHQPPGSSARSLDIRMFRSRDGGR